MIEELLQEITTIHDEQRREQLIRELASHPDDTLEPCTEMLWRGDGALRIVAVQVIRAIGYPANRGAIRNLVTLVSDLHSPARLVAMQTLLEMEPAKVIPHLKKSLTFGCEPNQWVATIAGICTMLVEMDVPEEYLLQCGDTVSRLLWRGDIPEDFDWRYLLNVIEKVGPQRIFFVAPGLIFFAQGGWDGEEPKEVQEQAQRLVDQLDQQEVADWKEQFARQHRENERAMAKLK